MSDPVAVATVSQLAADAAAETAALGGNAVDCGIAAALVAMNTQPGVCALAGGAYVTVWHPDEQPVTIDGGVAFPGLELDDARACDGGTRVRMEYGGGVETIVGGASVGVPGALAACETAVRRFGNLGFEACLTPSIRAARDGFPLPEACHHYLRYSGDSIFGRSDDGWRALHDQDGRLRPSGSTIVVPGLAESLAAIAEEGIDLFYRGDLAEKIVAHIAARGGRLTLADLARYRPRERPPLRVSFADWDLAVNPPPAIGGAILAAMLLATATDIDPGSEEAAGHLAQVQLAALGYRTDRLDLADDVAVEVDELLSMASGGELLNRNRSSATIHTSAADATGLACAVTASAGYGAGEIPAGTGLWLNNCLGELELNRRGLDAGSPGARLPSNMAPGAARCGNAVIAFGSPGADRITTALHQFLTNHLLHQLPLDAANAAPARRTRGATAGDRRGGRPDRSRYRRPCPLLPGDEHVLRRGRRCTRGCDGPVRKRRSAPRRRRVHFRLTTRAHDTRGYSLMIAALGSANLPPRLRTISRDGIP